MQQDDFEDFKRYEAYKREQEMAFARGFGNFLYRYICYSMTWFMSSASGAWILIQVLGVNAILSYLIAMFAAFFLFKLYYVKANPFKSMLTSIFVFTLLAIAFS